MHYFLFQRNYFSTDLLEYESGRGRPPPLLRHGARRATLRRRRHLVALPARRRRLVLGRGGRRLLLDGVCGGGRPPVPARAAAAALLAELGRRRRLLLRVRGQRLWNSELSQSEHASQTLQLAHKVPHTQFDVHWHVQRMEMKTLDTNL